ncbi:MAG: 50S ribosomal protein L35 [Pseudomonadota bacterium]
MPKMKTKSSAKKRFALTASGKVKFFGAKLRHNTSKRPQQMKRQNRGSQIMAACDARFVRRHFL